MHCNIDKFRTNWHNKLEAESAKYILEANYNILIINFLI